MVAAEFCGTILLLKDLGMPLKEIKQQLANRDPTKMLHILEEREHQIITEIAKLRSMEKWISQQKSKIHFAMQIDPTAIFIADFPERYYLYAEAPTATDAELYRKTDDLINLLLTVGSTFKNDYDMAYFQHASHIESFLKVEPTVSRRLIRSSVFRYSSASVAVGASA